MVRFIGHLRITWGEKREEERRREKKREEERRREKKREEEKNEKRKRGGTNDYPSNI